MSKKYHYQRGFRGFLKALRHNWRVTRRGIHFNEGGFYFAFDLCLDYVHVFAWFGPLGAVSFHLGRPQQSEIAARL